VLVLLTGPPTNLPILNLSVFIVKELFVFSMILSLEISLKNFNLLVLLPVILTILLSNTSIKLLLCFSVKNGSPIVVIFNSIPF